MSLTQTKQADVGDCQDVLKERFWYGALIPILNFPTQPYAAISRLKK
ncbi:MAG: hypothetical protein R2825_15895 [Saprospiraceae bacterium]